jgi:hypothetical protein
LDLVVGHHEAPGEIPSKSEEDVLSVGWNGCTVGREKIVADALLAPWDELSGKHAEVGTGVDQ